MDKLFEFLFRHPILLFVIGAWVVGLISNANKAKRRGAERRRQQQRAEPRPEAAARRASVDPQAAADLRAGAQTKLPEQGSSRPVLDPVATARPTVAPPQAQQAPAQQAPGQQASEEIAREMRRILGLEPAPRTAPRAPGPAWPEAAPAARAEPDVVMAQEGPRDGPLRTATRDRRIDVHVDPHVGEGIRDRHIERKTFDQRRQLAKFGGLGGRVQQPKRARAARSSRYSLDDLKTAIVMSEILSPPVSLRAQHGPRP